MVDLYLLTGSNLGNRLANLNRAYKMVNDQIGEILNCSSIYETQAWGFVHKNSFLNQALYLQTEIDVFQVLDKIQLIEKEFGRKRRGTGYEARIIDIDILFYNQSIITKEKLTVPHPLIQQRRFTLLPLAEIAPDLIHPILNNSIINLLNNCTDSLDVIKFQD